MELVLASREAALAIEGDSLEKAFSPCDGVFHDCLQFPIQEA